MKKILAIILAMIVCLWLASCGKNSASYSEEKSIKNSAVILPTDKDEAEDVDSDNSKHLVPYFYCDYEFGPFDELKYSESGYDFSQDDKAKPAKDNPDFMITENKDGVCINAYIGDSEKVVIPDYLNGKKVVRLDYYYDAKNEADETTTAPAINVTSVTEFHIPKYLKVIAYGNLSGWLNYYCGNVGKPTISKITVDKDNPYYSVNGDLLCTKDGKTALLYFGKNKTEYTIPDSVETLAESFNTIDLTNITIGKNVKSILGFEGEIYNEDSGSYELSDKKVSISGYKGTEAERFAKANQLKFISLD